MTKYFPMTILLMFTTLLTTGCAIILDYEPAADVDDDPLPLTPIGVPLTVAQEEYLEKRWCLREVCKDGDACRRPKSSGSMRLQKSKGVALGKNANCL